MTILCQNIQINAISIDILKMSGFLMDKINNGRLKLLVEKIGHCLFVLANQEFSKVTIDIRTKKARKRS